MCIMFWKKKKQEEPKRLAPKGFVRHDDMTSVVKQDIIVVEEVTPEIVAKDKKARTQKYHVSQNKDKEAEFYMKWRVRKDSSGKTIQYFDTQKLAIDFAQDLADKYNTTVVIHKLDGSIRKQDYTSKE